MDVLSANPYAMFLRRLDQSSLDSYRIHIRTDVKLNQRVYNSPTADQVAAIWIEGNNANVSHERDIIVHSNSRHKHRVQHYYGCYDPLQYPLLFARVYLALSGVQRNSNMKLQISVVMVVKWYSQVLAFKSLYANYICPNANKEKNSLETPEHIIVSSLLHHLG
ncbi:hypothetical protein RHGRI_003681 [Rhododendron griersonianum]|uniref:Uncharacterized protein n=1 Tax=Rhododendron griersonianum TaxID=479676 RepID=A0AAV6L6W3_9ERIC|nr:hypothetical protein RHGRI_003681 [Rhododendron griersonianum]